MTEATMLSPVQGSERIDLRFKNITTLMEMSNTFTPIQKYNRADYINEKNSMIRDEDYKAFYKALYPYTFEDALVFENVDFFAAFAGPGLNAKFRTAIAKGGGATAVGAGMYAALKEGKKAEFALDVLMAENFNTLKVPQYIAEGLEWLLKQMEKKQVEILTPAPATAVSVATADPGPGAQP